MPPALLMRARLLGQRLLRDLKFDFNVKHLSLRVLDHLTQLLRQDVGHVSPLMVDAVGVVLPIVNLISGHHNSVSVVLALFTMASKTKESTPRSAATTQSSSREPPGKHSKCIHRPFVWTSDRRQTRASTTENSV